MTTSCCPAYVKAAKVHVPEIEKFVSHTGSPMRYIAEIARERYKDAKIVFVGPCLGKRIEAENDPNVDYVLVFKDIVAVLNAMEVNVATLEAEALPDESSLQSRRRSGFFSKRFLQSSHIPSICCAKYSFSFS